VRKLYVVAFDARLPGWAREARAEYLKRMPRGFEVQCLELKSEAAKRLQARLPKGTLLVALDERGRDLTTLQFAKQLELWRRGGDPVAFVIGGPDGLAAGFKGEADWLLQLSALTLPHALAQVLLCEQLYRAAALLSAHPYHRGSLC
jgi:23S rRNA (pseudouridine1915-N3)-methyltransferase